MNLNGYCSVSMCKDNKKNRDNLQDILHTFPLEGGEGVFQNRINIPLFLFKGGKK